MQLLYGMVGKTKINLVLNIRFKLMTTIATQRSDL